MAAIQGKTVFPYPQSVKLSWASVTESDTFTASEMGTVWARRSVAVTGTFGSATVLIKGSWDGTNFFVLNSETGPLSFSSAGMANIQEICPYLQATHSGGTSESVTVTIVGVHL